MDDRGRVSLPTEFRRVLDGVGSTGALYIVPRLEDPRAHVVLTTEAYTNLIARHNEREYPSRKAQKRMEIKIMHKVAQVQVDDMGRIVLAKELRAEIGLEKDVRFVGADARFEIWRPDAQAEAEAELLDAEGDEDEFLDLRGLH
ncbi:MAG: division/cell wall cluster transcriptional repressor MraZ [Paracoccaceae bacterium]